MSFDPSSHPRCPRQVSVSVVVPAYNARNYLSEALGSILEQTVWPLEVLVIDDCSPEPVDDLVEAAAVVGREVRFEIIRHSENLGLGAARNTGIKAARGKWIAFLDHDDVWKENHLEQICSLLTQSGDAIGFSDVIIFENKPDANGPRWGLPDSTDEHNFDEKLFQRSFITPSAMVAEKALLESVGGFSIDPKVHMVEDLDLSLRLRKRGVRFAHATEASVFYRKHPGGATSRLGYMDFQSAYVRELHREGIAADPSLKWRVLFDSWWVAVFTSAKAGKVNRKALGMAVGHGISRPWCLPRKLAKLLLIIARR